MLHLSVTIEVLVFCLQVYFLLVYFTIFLLLLGHCYNLQNTFGEIYLQSKMIFPSVLKYFFDSWFDFLIGVNVYTHFQKYRAKSHSFVWFSSVFGTSTAQRTTFLCWYKRH